VKGIEVLYIHEDSIMKPTIQFEKWGMKEGKMGL
jgi:hypothetical protein